ncbi:MAG: hypothetical protein RMA76_14780 [Deltaproteobacteria bacterium]
MRRWAVLFLAVGCAAETPLPLPRDGGPEVVPRDGGVQVPPAFDPILCGATSDVDEFVAFDLKTPLERTPLLPLRSIEYGIPSGSFTLPQLTPDRTHIVYRHDDRNGLDRVVVIDTTRPQAAPTILFEGEGLTRLAVVSDTHVVFELGLDTMVAPIDGASAPVVAFSGDSGFQIAIAGRFIVREDRFPEERLTAYDIDRGLTFTLFDPQDNQGVRLARVIGDAILATSGSDWVRIVPTNLATTAVAPTLRCRQVLGFTADASEIFCDDDDAVTAYRTDGSTYDAPRVVIEDSRNSWISKDGEWIWWVLDTGLFVAPTANGTTTATVGFEVVPSIRAVSEDGQHAAVRVEGRTHVYGADGSLIAESDGNGFEFDPTGQFLRLSGGQLLDLETGELDTFVNGAFFTSTGGFALLRGTGMRMYRVDGPGRAEVVSDWFQPNNTLGIAAGDGVVTDRGAGGLWWTPRAAGESRRIADRGFSVRLDPVGDYVLAGLQGTEAYGLEAFALDGRHAEGTEEVWPGFPFDIRIAAPHVFGLDSARVVVVDVDGTYDAPREILVLEGLFVGDAQWSASTNQLVVFAYSDAQIEIIGVTPAGVVTTYASFPRNPRDGLSLNLRVEDDVAFLTFGGVNGPYLVALDEVTEPRRLEADGRVEAIFLEQRRVLVTYGSAADLVHLDTGEVTPITRDGFVYQLPTRSGAGFAYRVAGWLNVVRSLDPFEPIAIGFDATPMAFSDGDEALFHLENTDGRLYRYAFDLGWSQVLTDRTTSVVGMYPVDAPYPIVRAVVNGDYGVFALLRDGRLQPLLDEPDAQDFAYTVRTD